MLDCPDHHAAAPNGVACGSAVELGALAGHWLQLWDDGVTQPRAPAAGAAPNSSALSDRVDLGQQPNAAPNSSATRQRGEQFDAPSDWLDIGQQPCRPLLGNSNASSHACYWCDAVGWEIAVRLLWMARRECADQA